MIADKHILRATRDNPERGFRLLLDKYQEPVYWHIRRLVVDYEDARDAAQETFIRACRSVSDVGDAARLRPWLFRIATNEALRLIAARKGRNEISLEEATLEVSRLESADLINRSDQAALSLQRAILSLPAKQQLAFNLRYYDEMPYADIARIMGSTAANVKANYHVAKQKIVQYINENE